MNEKIPNHMNSEDEKIAQKLKQVAEQTHANAQFAAELQERLRKTRQTKTSLFMTAFNQFSPALRLVFLLVLLGVALSWSIKTLIPAPQPATKNTPVPSQTETSAPEIVNPTATASSEEGGYDFRGAKLYLKQPLPDSPGQANVYRLRKDEAATEEQARALANRLGVQGEVYTASGLIYGTTDYVVSDGQRLLQVHSNRYFTYTSNITKNNRNTSGFPNDAAESIIQEFLQAHGLIRRSA